jgi:hypothetical protein
MKMDRDLIGFDEASDPGKHLSVNETNWEGHEARVPPARKGPRQAWTPAPVASRASVNPPTARVAIPIAPPEDRSAVPSPRSFRTPAPVPSRSEHPVEDRPAGSSSTLVLVGAGLGAATVAVLGSVGVVAVVVAVLFVAGTPAAGGLAVEPSTVTPVVVTAAPGEPSRAVVSRQAEVAASPTAVAPVAAAAPVAAEPQGWVESTVRAVSSLVSPSAPRAAQRQAAAPRPVPHVEQVTGAPAAGAAAVNLSDYGMAAPATAPVAAGAAVSPGAQLQAPAVASAPQAASGELSLAGQVLVDRPGSATFSAQPVAAAAPVAVAAPVAAAAPAPSGWSNVVDTVTSLVTGAPAEPAPFAGPALVEPVAAPLDDMDDLLSALSTDRAAPAPAAGGEPDPMAALLADLEVQRPAPAAAPAAVAPAPASGGWYDTVVGVGSAVASLVSGGDPAEATFAAPAAVPVQVAGSPGGGAFVADDDEVLRASRTSGWDGDASVDDSTRAILAELDEPLPNRAGQPTQAAARTAPAARQADAPADAAYAPDDSMASLVAGLGDERAPAPQANQGYEPAPAAAPTYAAAAPAPAAPAASGGWYDTVVGVGSSVASMMDGGDDGLFAPAAAAPAAGPGLALDDEEVVRGRTLSGWETAASADDPTTAVLAELDGPMPSAGRPTMNATRAAAPASGGLDQDGTAALMASLDEEPAAPVASGGYFDTAASWAGSMAGALLGESPAPATPPGAPAQAPAAPAAPARAPVTAADAFFQSSTVSAAPAAPRDCADGEWCDDDLSTWRDDGGAGNLLAEDEIELGAMRRTDEGELFALPSDDAGPSGDFDVLSTYIVNVTTDVAGIPVEIDGKKVGTTPLVAEVAPGMHTVQLFGGGGAVTTYRLSADRDPEEWCFEVKGRSLKTVTCR